MVDRLERLEARRIMLEHLGSRVQIASIDELLETNAALVGLLAHLRLEEVDGPERLISVVSHLLSVEAELRDAELEAFLRGVQPAADDGLRRTSPDPAGGAGRATSREEQDFGERRG